MIGDKVNPKPKHRKAAKSIFGLIDGELSSRTSFTVAGQSGAGKSEIAFEMSRLLDEAGMKTFVIQQDDYFFYPPKTNHKRRVDDISWVGTQEVNLGLLDEHLSVFKNAGTKVLEKPLVVFEEDRMTTEKVDLSGFAVLIVEGTYTTLLRNVDYRIFIDRDYNDTLADRKERKRDVIDGFSERVLQIESGIISKHRALANIIVDREFNVRRAE